MSTRTVTILFLLTSACGPITVDIDLSGGDTDAPAHEGSGDTTEPVGETGPADSGSEVSTTLEPMDMTTSTGSGSTSESGSTGGPSTCVLPRLGTWCPSALAVAQAIHCGLFDQDAEPSSPEGCYATVAAMYSEGQAAILDAADCDPADPMCAIAMGACFDPVTSDECLLEAGTTLEACMEIAALAGIDAVQSCYPCARMLDLYDGFDSTGACP